MKELLPHIRQLPNQIVLKGGIKRAYPCVETMEGVVKSDCFHQAAVQNPHQRLLDYLD